MNTSRRLVLIGSIMLVVGSLMPWGKVNSAFGTMTISGTEGDGVITLVLGGIVLIIALTNRGKVDRIYSVSGIVFGAISLLLSGAALFRLGDFTMESESVNLSIGAGLYISILGSFIILIGSSRKVQLETTGSRSSEETSDIMELRDP